MHELDYIFTGKNANNNFCCFISLMLKHVLLLILTYINLNYLIKTTDIYVFLSINHIAKLLRHFNISTFF